MECELPCLESIFSSPHPFTEPNFRFTRNITIAEAFQSLFEEYPKQESSPGSQISAPTHEDYISQMGVFDMWILIHRMFFPTMLPTAANRLVLYAYINTHMALLIPFFQRERAMQAAGAVKPGPKKSNETSIPDDSILSAIRTALTRWRDQWITLRNKVPTDEWASMGFYKNGYNFWLVSHMLITKRESAAVVMQMEVKCEDKLEKLKVLLMDE